MSKPIYVDGEYWGEAPDDATEDEIMEFVDARQGTPAPPEKRDLGGQVADKVNAFGNAANDWMLAGWSDEYKAAMRTAGTIILGHGHLDEIPNIFHEYAGQERASISKSAEEHPATTLAGRTVGGTIGAVLSPSSEGATLAQNVGNAATIGAVAGAGVGETAEDRTLGAGVGAVVGGGLSAAPAAVTGAVQAAGKKLPWIGALADGLKPKTPEKVAAKLMLKQMLKGRDATIAEAEAKRLSLQPRAGGPVEETVGEMFDPNVQGLARAVGTVPGPGRTRAAEVLDARKKGIGGRLLAAVTGQKKSSADYAKIVSDAKELRRTEAKALYAAAHKAKPPINADEIVAPVVELDIGKKAAREGAELLDAAMGMEKDPRVKAQMREDIAYLKAVAKGASDAPAGEFTAAPREVDSWLENLAFVRKPIKEPETLTQFIRRQGGIRGDAAEMRGMGAKSLMNKNSRFTVNEMREHAISHGYLPETTDDRALLNAIDADLRGDKVYSDLDTEILQEMQYRDEILQNFTDEGVDALGDVNKARAQVRQKWGDGQPVQRQRSEGAGAAEAARAAVIAKGPSMRTMDYLQRGLARIAQKNPNDTQMAASATALQNDIVEKLSTHSKAFETAFNTYRERSSNIDFYELGRKAPNMSELQLAQAMDGASKADKDTFATGFAQGYGEALDKGETKVIKKFQEQKGFRKVLENSLPEGVFPVLEKRIGREAAMLETHGAIKSRSAQLAAGEDIKAATEENPADAVVENVIRNGGNIKQGLMNQAAKAYRAARRPGIYNKRANAIVTEHLWGKAEPKALEKLDNFLIENTDAPKLDIPDDVRAAKGLGNGGRNRGLEPWVTGNAQRSLDPHGQTQSAKAWLDDLTTPPEPEDDGEGEAPEITPGGPRYREDFSPSSDDGHEREADPQAAKQPISYEGEGPLLEDSGDGWVNDPITGAWRLRRPGDRVRPNQSLYIDVRPGAS